jgi:hypothetical protein
MSQLFSAQLQSQMQQVVKDHEQEEIEKQQTQEATLGSERGEQVANSWS